MKSAGGVSTTIEARALLSTVRKFFLPESLMWPVPARRSPVIVSSSQMLATSVLCVKPEQSVYSAGEQEVRRFCCSPVFVSLQGDFVRL